MSRVLKGKWVLCLSRLIKGKYIKFEVKSYGKLLDFMYILA